MCGFLAAMDILLSLFENVQVPLGTMHKADTKDPCAEYYHFFFPFQCIIIQTPGQLPSSFVWTRIFNGERKLPPWSVGLVTLYFPMTYHFLLPLTLAGVTVLIYPNQKNSDWGNYCWLYLLIAKAQKYRCLQTCSSKKPLGISRFCWLKLCARKTNSSGCIVILEKSDCFRCIRLLGCWSRRVLLGRRQEQSQDKWPVRSSYIKL